jgi:tRNA(Ile)-lysidine synthase
VPRLSGGNRIDPRALFAPLSHYRRIALAVSGGPDSLALLVLAAEYAAFTHEQQRFVVYSVDHGLRKEAAHEAAFVLGEAKRLGLEARLLRWTGEKPATGLQEAARDARYRLFGQAMRRDGAEVLATAHHLGDQAETVLMRLAHGSGIEGLRGMDYLSRIGDVTIVRPLLGIDPADLGEVVRDAGLTPVTDPSNADRDFERVRWRQLMPELEALGLDARRFGKFAQRMRDAETALAAMTAEALSAVDFGPGGDKAALPRSLLTGLPRAIAVRVVGRVLERVGGGRKPHALAAVEALTDRLIGEPVQTTLHGCIVRSGARTVRVSRETGRRAALESLEGTTRS